MNYNALTSASVHIIIPTSLPLQVFVQNVIKQDGTSPGCHTKRMLFAFPATDRILLANVTSYWFAEWYSKATNLYIFKLPLFMDVNFNSQPNLNNLTFILPIRELHPYAISHHANSQPLLPTTDYLHHLFLEVRSVIYVRGWCCRKMSANFDVRGQHKCCHLGLYV